MVQAIVNLSEQEDRVVQIVKGKFGLRTKAKAISYIIGKFGNSFLEPELRPEYVEKLRKIEKEGIFRTYSDLESLRKDIEGSDVQD